MGTLIERTSAREPAWDPHLEIPLVLQFLLLHGLNLMGSAQLHFLLLGHLLKLSFAKGNPIVGKPHIGVISYNVKVFIFFLCNTCSLAFHWLKCPILQYIYLCSEINMFVLEIQSCFMYSYLFFLPGGIPNTMALLKWLPRTWCMIPSQVNDFQLYFKRASIWSVALQLILFVWICIRLYVVGRRDWKMAESYS